MVGAGKAKRMRDPPCAQEVFSCRVQLQLPSFLHRIWLHRTAMRCAAGSQHPPACLAGPINPRRSSDLRAPCGAEAAHL